MNNLFEEANEAEDIPYKGKQSNHRRWTELTDEVLTTPDTIFTSSIDTNRSPDTYFVNTVTQRALPMLNANKHPDSTSISVLTQTMSPVDKIDSWFASTPAGPGQSSTSRPSTRDTALTSLAGDNSQLSNQKAGDAFLEPTATGPSTQDSFSDEENKPPMTQMDASAEVSGPLAANQSEPSTSCLNTRDPFFDSVPKGPSQLSTSRWNARAPAFDPWSYTRGEARGSSGNKTETPFVPGEYP